MRIHIGINEKRLLHVLERAEGLVSTREAAEMAGLPFRTAGPLLGRMAQAGLIRRHRTKRKSLWSSYPDRRGTA